MIKDRKTTVIGLPLLLIGGMILFPKTAAGQTYRTFAAEIERINTMAPWKFGPFRISPAFQISDLGYDNNVYRLPDTLNPVGDYTATIGVRADIHFLFRNWLVLTFTENPAYLYFLEQKEQRYLNNTYAFDLRMLVISRIALSGTYQSRDVRTFLSSEVDARVIQKHKEGTGRIFYETSRQTSLGFVGGIRELKYEDTSLPGSVLPISIQLNRKEISGAGEAYYRVFSDSFLFGRFAYVEYDFEFPQSKYRNSYSYQMNAGLRFPLLGRARGLVSLGFKSLIPRTSWLQSFSGLVGNTAVSVRLGRFDIKLDYSRDIPFSTYSDYLFYIENRYGAGISFYLNQFIRFDYNYRLGENSYPKTEEIKTPDGDLIELRRRDEFNVHSAAVVFRIIRNTGIGLRADYWQRSSSYSGYNVKRFFWGGYLTYEF